MELVGALHPGGKDRVAFCGVGTHDQHAVGKMQVFERTRVAAIAHGAKQPHGGRVLAVARAIVDVVGAIDRPGELLGEVGFLIAALAGRNEAQGIGAMLPGDGAEGFGYPAERFFPARLS